MPNPTLPILLILLAAPSLPADDSGMGEGVQTQLSIHQRIIIRVPRLPVGRTPIPTPVSPSKWVEKKGPKCVAMDDLSGNAIARADSVDLVMTGGKRVRAILNDDCPALDFYAGFYLRPAPDGQLCAGRDTVHSRSGGTCEISSFKRLVERH